jgi:hypothetical protein
MKKQVFATVLQVLGFASLTTGMFFWSLVAGMITAGLLALITGFALGQSR